MKMLLLMLSLLSISVFADDVSKADIKTNANNRVQARHERRENRRANHHANRQDRRHDRRDRVKSR